jgi:hypothetical protein
VLAAAVAEIVVVSKPLINTEANVVADPLNVCLAVNVVADAAVGMPAAANEVAPIPPLAILSGVVNVTMAGAVIPLVPSNVIAIINSP